MVETTEQETVTLKNGASEFKPLSVTLCYRLPRVKAWRWY